MEESNSRLKYLFELYQKKLASEKQVKELLRLLNAEPQETLDRLLEQYWEQSQNDDAFFTADTSDRMLAEVLSDKSGSPASKKKLFPVFVLKYVAAAVFVLVCGITLLLGIKKLPKKEPLASKRSDQHKTQDILPGGNKAVLKLSDGSVIILDDLRNGIISDQANLEISKTENGLVVFKLKSGGDNHNLSLLNTIETPGGGQYQVILPDNTKVWLNAESSIVFPSVFSGKFRKVRISGEVYFEVAKNPSLPFVVESENSTVEVLGTHFNVMDYGDDQIAKTTLLEGAVKISHKNKSEILKPGQQATYSDHSGLKLHMLTNPAQAIAWKNGFFMFEDASIEDVMTQVARWYNVRVSFEGNAPVNEFSGKISRNVKLSEFLRIVSYAGLNFRTEGRNVIVLNK